MVGRSEGGVRKTESIRVMCGGGRVRVGNAGGAPGVMMGLGFGVG